MKILAFHLRILMILLLGSKIAIYLNEQLTINKNLTEIDQLSEISVYVVSQIRQSMNELADMAGKLQGLVGSFKT